MQRREFFTGALAGSVAVGTVALGSRTPKREAEKPAPAKKGRMKVGHQHRSSDADLRFLAAMGVRNICSALPSRTFDDSWSVEGLTKLRERVNKAGIALDMVPLPMSSSPTSRAEYPNIMLGKSPERDREIDHICQMIRNVARVGIPAVKYNLTLIGVLRTEPTKGRGGVRYSTFVHDKSKPDDPPLKGGPVSAEQMWERIAYFVKRVVPVAEECKVHLCCHPHDPGMPGGKPYRGMNRVLGTVEGLKRFVNLSSSKYHGLNFCQGSVAEMLEKPGEEIYEVIRYFGRMNRIFNVHFRNIKGSVGNFHETFPDEGDVDMLRALRVYREVGYDGMIMPDHVPVMDDDPGREKAFAFAFGHIHALLQVVNSVQVERE